MTEPKEAPFADTPKLSQRKPMELVHERQAPDQSLAGLIAAQATTTIQTQPKLVSRETSEFQHRAAWKAGVLASINVLAIVLAVRLALLVAVVGAIILTLAVIQSPDPWRVASLAIYTIATVIPTVWLSSRR